MTAYRHVVLFRVHDHVAEPEVEGALAMLRALHDLPGVEQWTVHRSDDERKGRILCENALLADRSALEAFRVHPRHAEVSAVMREISDWWIADHDEP